MRFLCDDEDFVTHLRVYMVINGEDYYSDI